MLAWGPTRVAKFEFFARDFEFGRHLCVPGITSGRAISFYTWANPCFPPANTEGYLLARFSFKAIPN